MRNTTLCYIEKDGCYLLLHRVKKERDINRDKWIGVGGGFENRESPEDCLLREVHEVTGLTLTSYRLRGVITFVTDRWETEYMFLYTADGFFGELIDCDEGTLEWFWMACHIRSHKPADNFIYAEASKSGLCRQLPSG